ncbi:hypothetical protein LXL04_001504 [Taraxacum kok-saghyz]
MEEGIHPKGTSEHLCLRAGRGFGLQSRKERLFFRRQKRFAEVKTSAGGKTWFKVCGREDVSRRRLFEEK